MICAWSAELRALQLLELRLEDDFAWYSFLRKEPWAAYKHMQHAVRAVCLNRAAHRRRLRCDALERASLRQ